MEMGCTFRAVMSHVGLLLWVSFVPHILKHMGCSLLVLIPSPWADILHTAPW